MAKFSFPLQRVLDVRKHLENQKAQELSIARNKMHHEQQQMNEMKEKKQGQMVTPEKGTVNMSEVFARMAYVGQINKQISEQQKKMNATQREIEKKRAILNEAVKERKAVEILKDKHRLEFKKQENREYAKRENEVALRMKTYKQDEA